MEKRLNIIKNRYNKNSKINFSINQIKIVAMISMLIDHIGLMLIGNGKLYGYDNALLSYVIALNSSKNWLMLYRFCRFMGRISFPLYAFCIVEGFYHTSNLFKYYVRLFILALISEIPFDLMVHNKIFCFDSQNVLWTYLIGLTVILIFDKLGNKIFSVILKTVIFILACAAAYYIKSDYSYIGVALITFLYITRADRELMIYGNAVITGVSTINTYYGFAALSTFFIYFYDGRKGALNLSKLFYYFYPIHMLILYLIVYLSYLQSNSILNVF